MFFKRNQIVIGLLLIGVSTVINVLYYIDRLPKWGVQTGFTIVILWSAFVNLSLLNKDKNRQDTVLLKKRSVFSIVGVILLGIAWIISYAMANFYK